jgi:hypothetical protein
MLSHGMSQTTTNLIASCLNVHPRLVMSDHLSAAYRQYYGIEHHPITIQSTPTYTATTSAVDFAAIKTDDADWTSDFDELTPIQQNDSGYGSQMYLQNF